jgi:protein-S-isoprenylcysteine O-methyltransferase Ste14
MRTTSEPRIEAPKRTVPGKDGIQKLIGSGDTIGIFTLPFLAIGLVLQFVAPSAFRVGGPPGWLKALSWVVLSIGIVNWAWSAALILVKVPKGELVTGGPFVLVRHPLYTGMAFLVLPWAGFIFDTWLGAALGVVLYVATRIYAPEEERELSRTFGGAWTDYSSNVKLPWV